ncbi:RICIN domain-containing protein [uncultured Aquimarina sp.]|uniref:RICIN domain-containing protein n=1 Tax=uncultured Aquimarina sp. TaxID=575652 RepID=UPI00260C8090|nr:RICIN domain-containing protein [uncultured Aquimarina sp.]
MKKNQTLRTFFRKCTWILLFILGASVYSKNIYVSKNGNDTNPGTQSQPYKTIGKASAVAQPGDIIFIGGGTYEEIIKPARSGQPGQPITYTSKQGEKVIISAMQALSGWQKDNGAIYKVKVDWNLGQENFVMNGSTAMDLARWPNNSDGKPFTLNSLRNAGGSGSNVVNNAYLTSSQIPNINWTGGSVFFYGDKPGSGWIAWKAFITSSSSGRVNFNLDKNPNWIRTFHAPADKGDFYLEGVKGALDYQNEWWFNSQTKELFVQMPGGVAPSNGSVQMRKRKTGIDLNGRSYIEIRNLAVFGGAILLKTNSNNNKLYGVSSFYGNHTQGVFKGFNAGKPSIEVNGTNNVIEKCEIAFSAATGVRLGGRFNVLKNNYIHDFNYLGSYDAPLVARGGNDNKIIGNTIFNGGRDGINFNGNRCEVAYNDVYRSNLIADDCATFYTVGGPQNTEIHHNWFHDSASRGSKRKAAGIYLDNDAEAFSVHHNVVWNVEWTGVQINWNGKDIDIFNNTLVKTEGGAMGAWHKEGTAFSNVKVWNNIADVRTEDDPSTQEDEGTFERDADKQNNVITQSGYTNYNGNNFTLTSSSPAVNAGRTISGITDGFVGSAPDAGAYEFGGENWVPGINWNSDLGPTGNGCYGLPGESCSVNNIEDLVEFINPSTLIQPQLSYDFQIKYSAKVKREIVIEFWSSTSWLGQKEIEVEAGEGTVDITLDLPTAPAPGTDYVYKLHIRPINTTWENAIDRDQVNNVTVQNEVFEDKVSFKDVPTTITQANLYSVDVNYEASTNREVIVEFWSSTNWIAQQKEIVSKGTGVKTITVNLPNLPQPGSGYVYKTHIRPLSTSWQDAIDRDQINNVTVTAAFAQLIVNGSYYIESTQSNQRLLSRAADQHSAVMSNPYPYNDQAWVFDHKGDNVYTIRNSGTNRFLEVPYARCANGENVATWTDANDNHKKWKVVQNGNGVFGLKPMHCSTSALDRAGGSINANVQIWDFNTVNANQKWKIVSLNNRENPIEEKGKALSVYPNPSREEITVQGAETNDIVIIYDLMGKIIKKTKLTTNNEPLIISDMTAGLYILSVFGKDKIQFIKD